MTGPREEAWEAEDRTEGVDVPGTRKDIGVGSQDRSPDFGPTGAEERGVAGTISTASADTSVESAGETDRTGPPDAPD